MPQDWRADNKQLQLRPVLHPAALPAGADGLPSHAWSYGVSSGQHSVQLASMEDGSSRLLCCTGLGQPAGEAPAPGPASSSSSGAPAPSSSPIKAAAAAPSCWFSTCCEASELVLQGGVDVLSDWSVTAQPPLTLRNDLPVAGHYVLWERAARGGALAMRQQGHLAGGASATSTLLMRQQVCLTSTLRVPSGASLSRAGQRGLPQQHSRCGVCCPLAA
ncbi:hypothetical protein COO60DRAFT_940688 [Scenedesmus sp. NREL 46B-D3]|nr:hypothetical protein COO60DRAFT_940688 [Scenedesmus sp. NREL 46B-D3]